MTEENGGEGLSGLGNQRVSEMNLPENLRRCDPNSADVGFTPLNSEGPSSVPREDNEKGSISGFIYYEDYKNQVKELRNYCEGLQGLLENMRNQVKCLHGVVSKIYNFLDEPLLLNNASLAVCTAVVPREEPSVANNAKTMDCAIVMVDKGVGPETPLLSVCMFPKLEEADTIMVSSPERRSPATTLGNDDGQCSSLPASSSHGLAVADTTMDRSPETRNPATSLGNDDGQCSSLPPSSSRGLEVADIIMVSSPERSSPATSLGNDDGLCSSLPASCSHGLEVADIIMVSSPERSSPATSLGNDNGLCSSLPASCSHGLEVADVIMVSSPERRSPATSLGNEDCLCSSLPASCSHGLEVADIIMVSSPERRSPATSLGNDNGLCSSLPASCSHGLAIKPMQVLVRPENGMENSHGTVTNPAVLENNNNQNFFLIDARILASPGLLGDPKRNVHIANYHLAAAQRKPQPKHAARYLVRVLFSKEVLAKSSAGISFCLTTSRNYQILEPNKMAALREFLATAYPNHDLGENGKVWKGCLSYINSLIRYFRTYKSRQKAQNAPVNNEVPANPNAAVPADLNATGDDDGSECCFQVSQQGHASETRVNDSSERDSSAVPEGYVEPGTKTAKIPLDALTSIGHSRRNVQLPRKIVEIAKMKPCPEQAATYLVCNLFAEDILMEINIFDNVMHSLYALNPNRIMAMQEFLQETYPNSDLSEVGDDWKLCVAAIENYIYYLKHGFIGSYEST